MSLTDNAKIVIERRIAAKDAEGNALETAEEVFKRVAINIAEADRNYGATDEEVSETSIRFYNLMESLDFLPNSPTLVNAGRELQQLSACFVVPVEDSMEGIFDAVKKAALIHKTGGGTGFSFSRLRPANSRVDKTSGIASGPVSFMQVFDKATEVIKQGGTRRGANMGILRVDHPDIVDFIHIKDDLSKLTNFNISVAITDEFMNALREGRDYDLIHPDGTVVRKENAGNIWKQIIESAHKTGDPGIIFIDRINNSKANPVPERGPIESTNPCGEQPLYPWDSCNLGSINLANFVNGDKIDFERLEKVVEDSVHFLDNVIDMNKWVTPEIAEVSNAIRRIGLGVMGWADMLIKLNIPYDSEKAIGMASEVMNFISNVADRKSTLLGLKRGSFPDFERSIYKTMGWPALRNSTRTTVAPTGTISIIAGCSSGIEPVFAFEYTRSHYLDKNDTSKRTELKEVYEGYDPEKDYFVDAFHVTPEWHILMQAAFQAFTDNAVSKTINMPKESTIDDVESAYLLAWQTGCKGVTIYRDGSRDNQVLSVNKEMEVREDILLPDVPKESSRNRLPDTRNAVNHKFSVGDFEGYISVGTYEDGRPGEVFIIGNKTGSTTRGYLDTIGSILSLSLQYGIPLEVISNKLSGSRFEPMGFTGNTEIPVASSVMDYIARWLRKFETGESKGTMQNKHNENTYIQIGDLCPECDGVMEYGEGCSMCRACGFSRCG